MSKYILGIECTAHTFGAGVVDNSGNILSNVKDTYTTEKGGIVPLEAAKHHHAVAERIFAEALAAADIDEGKISAIAVSIAPGLPPCLKGGLNFVKALSHRLKLPVVPVNHCIAHLEIGGTTGAKDPVLLYVSGANTQIIAYEARVYRIFGETLDIGVGNFLDTFARAAGIGFPGGPKIAEAAAKSHNYIELPYVVKGMDMSFSGLLTKLTQMHHSGKYKFEDLCYSLQETAFAMLVEAAERAMAHTGKKELLLGGGVACNSRLQEMCRIMCEERGAKFFCPERPLLVDNAAMIAYLGAKMFKKGIFVAPEKVHEMDFDPRQRTDGVTVGWK